MICPACGAPTRRNRVRVFLCQSCRRRWHEDGSELVCPICVRCGGRTGPQGTDVYSGKLRYKCESCGLLSAMDKNSTSARPHCPRCHRTAKKNGLHRGQQGWRCNHCGRQFTRTEGGNSNGEVLLIQTPYFFGDTEIDGIVRYEPPPCPNDRRPCSKCRHVMECGNGTEPVACEGFYVILSGGSEVRM